METRNAESAGRGNHHGRAVGHQVAISVRAIACVNRAALAGTIPFKGCRLSVDVFDRLVAPAGRRYEASLVENGDGAAAVGDELAFLQGALPR